MPSPRIVQEELLESAPPPEMHAGYGVYKPPSYEVEEGDAELPFSRLRLLIADHMVYSKRTSAHVTTIAEADFEHIVGIRQLNKDKVKAEVGIGLTYTPFVMAAAIRTLKEFPLMNSVVQGYAILTKRHINLGVAVDSERGLMVPVIKGAEDMSLLDLAKALSEISVKVRDKKITPDEMAGGTFTVTNPGRHGNLFGTPIISQPQVGILRMGELVKRAVVVTAEDGEDAIAIRPMMYIALSYDHRVVDGLTANEFLHRIKEHLEAGDFEVMRLLSGMRPTGRLHIGHLVGALGNWLSLQEEYECFFMAADWHALTTAYADTSELPKNIMEMALDWRALGIDFGRSTVFVQSDVKEHAELYLLFGMITPMPWLERDPTLKNMIEDMHLHGVNYGLMGYPVLQAADIMLYKAGAVPVGIDQVPHIELAREIARAFNHRYKRVFPEPKALLTQTPKLPGTDGRKMSKSLNNAIFLDERAGGDTAESDATNYGP